MLCRGFRGISNENINKLYNVIHNWEKLYPVSLIDIGNIDKRFIQKIAKYNDTYISYQIENINNTLSPTTKQDYKLQIDSAYNWCDRYKMPINPDNKYTNIFK